MKIRINMNYQKLFKNVKKKEETFKINEIIKLEIYSISKLSSYMYDFIKSGLKKTIYSRK